MQNKNTGQWYPCYTSRSLGCQQIVKATFFRNIQIRKTFNIFHQIACKSSYAIYLLERIICKIKYVQKSEMLSKSD